MTPARRTLMLVAVVGCIVLIGCGRHAPQTPSPATGSAPSAGQNTLDGAYTFVADGTHMAVNGAPRAGGVPSRTTWRVTPCGPGCAAVTSSLGWTTELRLTQNTWKATRNIDVDCGHGAATMTYALDATTLTGTVTNDIPCGSTPSVAVEPATLTKN